MRWNEIKFKVLELLEKDNLKSNDIADSIGYGDSPRHVRRMLWHYRQQGMVTRVEDGSPHYKITRKGLQRLNYFRR